jgi:hypothetical protein
MSHFPTSALTRAAALTALVLPLLSACANEQSYAGRGQYYADRMNPVPEVSGQKIRPFEVRTYADVTNPHPELMGFPNVSIANAPTPAPSE